MNKKHVLMVYQVEVQAADILLCTKKQCAEKLSSTKIKREGTYSFYKRKSIYPRIVSVERDL